MSEKVICVAFSALLLALSFPARAQDAGKVYRIGYLRFGSGSPTTNQRYIAFRQGLRELGYVEGQNLVIEYRSAERKRERRPELAAELVRLKVDVIVTPGAPGLIRAALGATRTIPIVVAGFRTDPVEARFVVSLTRPGGNITGVTNRESELHGKRLEILKEAFPRISRVVILWPSDHQKHGMKEIEAAAQALGIQILSLVRTAQGLDKLDEHLENAFSAISRERPDALLVADSALVSRHKARIIEFTAKRRLPTMFIRSRFVKAGGLTSYGANLPHLFRQAANFVDKILRGAKPGDLPVERPTKFELVINLKTAKQLGLTIPPEFLLLADKVIK